MEWDSLFLLKYPGYVLWFYLAFRWFRPDAGRRLGRVFGLSLLRILVGLVLGLAIFALGGGVYHMLGRGPVSWWLSYAATYVPVRWFEWAFMELFVLPGPLSARALLLGSPGGPRAWRAVGVAISCLGDLVLMIAAPGFPFEKFMC